MKKGHEAQVEEMRNVHRNLIWKFKGTTPLGKTKCFSKSDRTNVEIKRTLSTNLLITTVAVNTRNLCVLVGFFTL